MVPIFLFGEAGTMWTYKASANKKFPTSTITIIIANNKQNIFRCFHDTSQVINVECSNSCSNTGYLVWLQRRAGCHRGLAALGETFPWAGKDSKALNGAGARGRRGEQYKPRDESSWRFPPSTSARREPKQNDFPKCRFHHLKGFPA